MADQWIFGNTHIGDFGSLITDVGTFVTNASEFTPGTPNQGWWSATLGNATINFNFDVGTFGLDILNNFFTFKLNGSHITTAKLSAFNRQANGDLDTTYYTLWDVITDPAVLNDKDNSPNATIFNDLGSGISYGYGFVPDLLLSDPIVLTLNATAIAAINAAGSGYFSIGGSLSQTPPTPPPCPCLLHCPGGKAIGIFTTPCDPLVACCTCAQ